MLVMVRRGGDGGGCFNMAFASLCGKILKFGTFSVTLSLWMALHICDGVVFMTSIVSGGYVGPTCETASIEGEIYLFKDYNDYTNFTVGFGPVIVAEPVETVYAPIHSANSAFLLEYGQFTYIRSEYTYLGQTKQYMAENTRLSSVITSRGVFCSVRYKI